MIRLKKRCNILVAGTLSSGSSALYNLLKEYDNIGHFSNEFDDFRAPGLVGDQLSDTSRHDFPNQIARITRNGNFIKRLVFKSSIWNYLYKSIPKQFLEIEYPIKSIEIFRNKLISLERSHLLRVLNKSLETDISFDEKIQISNNWIQQVGNIFSLKKDYTMFDNALPTKSDLAIWTTVFNPYKLIVVYRNPRDQIADIIKRGFLFKPYGNSIMTLAGYNLETIYGRDRIGAIRLSIDSIRCRLKWIEYLEKVIEPNNLLVLDFEGLINNYDVYKSKIEDFIGGIKNHHRFKNKYFNPLHAKGNIDIYKQYLYQDDLPNLAELEDWYINKVSNRDKSL